jgi:transcriptional regulator with XRE-family HTH domain
MEVTGYSQVQLAPKLGVGQTALSNLVTDSSRKPSAPTLLKLCEVLGVSPHWIIFGDGDPFAWAPVTSDQLAELVKNYNGLTRESQGQLLQLSRTLPRK